MNRVTAIVLVIFIGALTVRGAGSPPQALVIPTNGAPSGPRTGMILGQVVDSAGTPVPEAIVQMSMPTYLPELPTTPRGRVMADAEGRFFFSDLPAGDYYLRASKEGYAGGEYGQRRATGDNRSFSLTEGERRVDAKLTLWKFAVIGGTVLDEAGEPVIGVSVQALVSNVVAGRTAYGTAGPAAGATTDDRGMFRLSRLPPGRYVVVVPLTQTTFPVGLLSVSNTDTALRNELFAAIAETAPLGQPRTQQFGDYALLTLNRMLIPPALSPAGRMEVYRTTYFPAATKASAATTITVAAGEERTDVRIGLRPAPAVRISGRLVTPDGTPPPPTSLRLVGDAAADVDERGFETVTAISDASGRFTLLGVPAGEYVLKNSSPSLLALSGLQGRQGWWMAQPVTVGTADIPNLVVTLRPALRVEGRVEFLGTTATPPPVPELLRSAISFQTPFSDPGSFSGQHATSANVSFATIAAAGHYIVRPFEIGGWFTKSVTLDGKDITDRVFELQSDATSFVVVYTDRVSKVTGAVKDGRGAASTTAVVLAFPVDPQRWTGYGSSPRNLKSALVTHTGAYTIEGLPAGDYYIVAIDDAESEGWMDPKMLESLARQSTRLTVIDVEQKTLDLTVKAIR